MVVIGQQQNNVSLPKQLSFSSPWRGEESLFRVLANFLSSLSTKSSVYHNASTICMFFTLDGFQVHLQIIKYLQKKIQKDTFVILYHIVKLTELEINYMYYFKQYGVFDILAFPGHFVFPLLLLLSQKVMIQVVFTDGVCLTYPEKIYRSITDQSVSISIVFDLPSLCSSNSF